MGWDRQARAKYDGEVEWQTAQDHLHGRKMYE